MNKKFIPNGDEDFVTMARQFARAIADDAARYHVAAADAAELTASVEAFGTAFQAARYGARSQVATLQKETARAAAERIIRRLAHGIRANPSIDAAARMIAGIRERSTSPKPQGVPNEAPTLRFVRAVHENGGLPEHELTAHAADGKPRPAGATRLELFVDLIPADADPHHFYTHESPARPIYLRSYTRSPIRLLPPMARQPMRVIYWARWADASGEVGPLSKPTIGWIEGGTHHLMGPTGLSTRRPTAWAEIGDERRAHETTVLIAMVAPHAMLEARPVMRQIEGPAEAAA